MRTGHDHDVVTEPPLETSDRHTESLTESAPGPIARDGAPERAWSGDCETNHLKAVWPGAEREHRMLNLHSFAPHRGDVRIPPQTRGVHE